ncbi:MAG: acyloxyacyl hydrolase [Candidatus Binataceae bacterium]
MILLAIGTAARAGAQSNTPQHDSSAAAAPADGFPFSPWTKVFSLEGGFAHFSSGRLPGNIQSFNLGAGIAVMPFGVTRFRFLHGALDGALELGVEPTFARFIPPKQNFAGLAFGFRYNLVHFSYGPFVPWIAASIAPGGSDLNIGTVSGGTRLTGPFLALVRGEAGVSYFVGAHGAIYVGLQGEHFSNGSLNGYSSRNFSLNTPLGGVFGVSWYFH